MAALKLDRRSRGSSAVTKTAQRGSIFTGLKLLISHTTSKINNKLRTQDDTKVTKPKATGKTTNKQETLERAITNPSHDSEISQASTAETLASKLRPDNYAPPAALPHPTLTARDFELGGSLGRGAFGCVYLSRHRTTNYICALKIISKAQCTSASEEKLIRRELEIHQHLTHKNILKLLSWFHDDKSIYLVLEYAAGGSLYSRMKKQPKRRFDEKATAGFIAQMASALRYMHSKHIMHRDIKPENILLGLHSEIKLADFGYSVHSESGLRSTVCGTLDYYSPEVALMLQKPGENQEYYTNAIDQWSLGVLTYELLVGKPPFKTKSSQATQKKIADFTGKGLRIPGHVSEEAGKLIKELLNLDAEKRMSLDDVLRHPWIKKNVEMVD
ncbi:hypothetical protein NX059_008974 [Plenodomus lindquistii]|nr:hypothetical protein NX059_008974 [Plenodomus lindquistii]